jgi:hypothetical protein
VIKVVDITVVQALEIKALALTDPEPQLKQASQELAVLELQAIQ